MHQKIRVQSLHFIDWTRKAQSSITMIGLYICPSRHSFYSIAPGIILYDSVTPSKIEPYLRF